MTVQITREQFEEMTADLLQRTIDTAQLVLEQAEVTADQLDAIVLVGGSTLMPKVPEMLKQLTGKEPFQGLSPHTAVAQGAAIHAAILEAKFRGESSELAERIRKLLRNVKQEDVNSHGLGVAARNPKTGKTVNHVMIPRNSKLPTEVAPHVRHQRAQPAARQHQGDRGDAPDPAACSLLGNCRITGLPQEPAQGLADRGRLRLRRLGPGPRAGPRQDRRQGGRNRNRAQRRAERQAAQRLHGPGRQLPGRLTAAAGVVRIGREALEGGHTTAVARPFDDVTATFHSL